MICEQINEELLQTQKVLILLQLLEVHSNVDKITEGELDFIKTVAISFKIDIQSSWSHIKQSRVRHHKPSSFSALE